MISDDTRAFVESQRVARLATVDARGHAHVVPVCFALAGDTVYTAVDEKPKRAGSKLQRLRNIEANPNVQVLVDRYDDAVWSLLRFVQFRGRARVVEAADERERAHALLRARYPQYGVMVLGAAIAVDIERVVEWRAAGG